MNDNNHHISIGQIFKIFLRLGLTSFGGPVAHLGYFRQEFVERQRWLKDEVYADLVALCQFLPGPASSQVGIGIGLARGGLRGAIAAWVGFTLPSAIVLVLFAYGLEILGETATTGGWLGGLKIAAVAVVAQAVWGMANKLCPDSARRILALLATLIASLFAGISGQLVALGLSALCGWFFLKPTDSGSNEESHLFPVNHLQALGSLVLFFLLLVGLPVVASLGHFTALADSFYRAGSLVFGGGHVVLPLLQAEVVENGWLNKDLFLAGYGAVQAVPGPLFTFSAYLGAAMESGLARWSSALLCVVAIFLPSFLLVVGILPYWDKLRSFHQVRKILIGVNAGVVGLLTAAFFNPVLTSGIHNLFELLLALVAFWLLQFKSCPSWAVVLICALTGGVIL